MFLDGGPARPSYRSAQDFLSVRSSRSSFLLIGTIAVLLISAGAWSALGEVEETVRGTGRVAPTGQVKIINHPRGGRVISIDVREGEEVQQGQVLLRLDGDQVTSEFAELTGRLQLAAAETARLESEATGQAFVLPPEIATARPDLGRAQTMLLRARGDALQSQHATLARSIDARRGELASATAEYNRAHASLGHLGEELVSVRALAERGLYPKLRLIGVEREAAEAQGGLEKAAAAMAAARADLAVEEARLQSLDKQWRQDVLTQLVAARGERDRLREQANAKRIEVESLAVVAPVAGTVLDLDVAAAGQSIPANQPIMKIVPRGERLEVEARVHNEDIGRIRTGLPVTVKVRAFDYLRYGVIEGHVDRIAADATREPETGIFSYVVSVAIDRGRLATGGGQQRLTAGMMADIEVNAGMRTIFSYLTDRLWRLQDAAFRDG